jgi:MFS family permease
MTQPPAKSRAPTASRAALLTVFLVVFIDLLGFGIVLPLMPRYADRLLAPAGISSQLHGAVIGALLSVFSFMQFLFAPIWGRVSDRIGRKPILVLGLAGSVVFYALFGYGSSLIRGGDTVTPTEDARLALLLMFVARIGAGIAGATIATAQAVIADCTPKEKRAHGMAMIGAAFGIGFTFGPLLAGAALIFFPDRPEFAGYAAAILSLAAWMLAIARCAWSVFDSEHADRGDPGLDLLPGDFWLRQIRGHTVIADRNDGLPRSGQLLDFRLRRLRVAVNAGFPVPPPSQETP